MSSLIWYLTTVIGLSMASPLLVYSGLAFLGGDYLLSGLLLAIGVIAVYFPTFAYHRLRTRQKRAIRTTIRRVLRRPPQP